MSLVQMLGQTSPMVLIMPCPKCGGTLCGDDYTVVLHCENVNLFEMDCFPEPYAGPIYCNYPNNKEMGADFSNKPDNKQGECSDIVSEYLKKLGIDLIGP